MWIDCNVHVESWSPDRRHDWAQRAKQCQISAAIWSGTHPPQWADANPEGFPRAFGLHPLWVHRYAIDTHLDALEGVLRHGPSAVGEIGLDWRAEADRATQEHACRQQLNLAKRLDRAVILHVVRAHEVMLDLLRETGVTRFMVHGFSGAEELARAYLRLGGVIGLGGLVTRAAPRLHRTVRSIPWSAFVLESDAPDLPPAGAQVSDPTDLPRIAEAVAALRGSPVDSVSAAAEANARRVFGDLLAQLD